MQIKTLFISLGLLFLISCSTLAGYPGYYSIKAYDSNGNRLDGINLINAGSTIYTTIKGTCLAFPGATLVIKNTKTGQELSEESPYQCKGKKADIIHHSFIAPKQINFSGIIYKLAYKGITVDKAIYEYTSNNEKIESWNKLITLFYRKGARANTPNEFIKERKEAFRPIGTIYGVVAGSNGYTNIIFKPRNKYPYYETAVSKSFHIEKCEGRVRYTYAEKYPKNSNIVKIKNAIRRISTQLRDDIWLPSCMTIKK